MEMILIWLHQAKYLHFRIVLYQIWAEFGPNLVQIRFTKTESNSKPEFGPIRTRIIRPKTNLNEFKTNRIQIRPRLPEFRMTEIYRKKTGILETRNYA